MIVYYNVYYNVHLRFWSRNHVRVEYMSETCHVKGKWTIWWTSLSRHAHVRVHYA